jgi:hypothetical protein
MRTAGVFGLVSVLAGLFVGLAWPLDLRGDEKPRPAGIRGEANHPAGRDIGSGIRRPQIPQDQTRVQQPAAQPRAAAPATTDGHVSHGIGQIVSGWTHQGIHGQELAARIHALKANRGHGKGVGHGNKGGGGGNAPQAALGGGKGIGQITAVHGKTATTGPAAQGPGRGARGGGPPDSPDQGNGGGPPPGRGRGRGN